MTWKISKFNETNCENEIEESYCQYEKSFQFLFFSIEGVTVIGGNVDSYQVTRKYDSCGKIVLKNTHFPAKTVGPI